MIFSTCDGRPRSSICGAAENVSKIARGTYDGAEQGDLLRLVVGRQFGDVVFDRVDLCAREGQKFHRCGQSPRERITGSRRAVSPLTHQSDVGYARFLVPCRLDVETAERQARLEFGDEGLEGVRLLDCDDNSEKQGSVVADPETLHRRAHLCRACTAPCRGSLPCRAG